MNIKRILTVLILTFIIALPAISQEESKKYDNESDLTYVMATIYKVLETTDSYVVIYRKNGAAVGSVTIPKKWERYSSTEEVRKLQVRALPPRLDPYITVVTKNGEFYKVFLTLPVERSAKVWGRLKGKTDTDVDSIESIELAL